MIMNIFDDVENPTVETNIKTSIENDYLLYNKPNDELFQKPKLISQTNITLEKEIGFQKLRTFIAYYEEDNVKRKVVAKEVDLEQEKNNNNRIYKQLLSIKDENIVQHIGLVESDSKIKQPLIVMEFVEGETLREKLLKLNTLELKYVIEWALQIAKGMLKLHDYDIIHRDLSTNNIMISTDKSNNRCIFKIIDIADQTIFGTPLNMAPEAFNGDVCKQSDVFSFGSVLWELVTCLKKQPFDKIDLNCLSRANLAFKIGIEKKTLKIPDNCDAELGQLMRECWNYEPNYRPTFKQICERLENQKLDSHDMNYVSANISDNLPTLLFND